MVLSTFKKSHQILLHQKHIEKKDLRQVKVHRTNHYSEEVRETSISVSTRALP